MIDASTLDSEEKSMPAKKKGTSGASWLRRGYSPTRAKRSTMTYSPGKVFVAMAFSDTPERSKTYQAILRACESFNLNASRVDEIPGSGNILIRIVDAIEQGEFLIFDLSTGRPNVYYELGYAHGVGNRPEDIVLIAKKGTKIHFDLASLRIVFYNSSRDLEGKLKSEFKQLRRLSRVSKRRPK